MSIRTIPRSTQPHHFGVPSIIESIVLLALLAFLVAVLIPFSPSYFPVPTRDAGLFLYAGKIIRQGGLPYLDIWDQKPPLIFYINALGLVLGGGSAEGVYWLKVALLLAGAAIGFRAMRRSFGVIPALFGTLVWMSYRPLLTKEGNIAEEYALPLQLAALALVVSAGKDRDEWKAWLIAGTLGGLAFLLKPTLIGAMLAAMVILIAPAVRAHAYRHAARAVLVFIGGMAIPIGASILIAFAQGYLPEYWSAVVLYAVSYAAVDQNSYAEIWARMLSLFQPAVLVTVGLGTIASALRILAVKRGASPPPALLGWALVALPLDACLLSLPHRSFMYYYLALLPTFSVLLASLLYLVQEGWRRVVRRPAQGVLSAGGVAIAVLIGSLTVGRIAYRDIVRTGVALAAPRPNTLEPVMNYLDRTTAPDDTVLIWGAEAGANFVSGHDAPTRFVHQYFLFMPGYVTVEMISEFSREVVDNPPQVIIDAVVTAPGGLPTLQSMWSGEWRGEAHDTVLEPAVVERWREWADWVRDNYTEDGTLGEWTMYVRT
jgi:4-amino-4-deoxy-L-arabinose transferase-like glycosyltransferase